MAICIHYLDKAADLGLDLFPDNTRKNVSPTDDLAWYDGVWGWLVSLRRRDHNQVEPTHFSCA